MANQLDLAKIFKTGLLLSLILLLKKTVKEQTNRRNDTQPITKQPAKSQITYSKNFLQKKALLPNKTKNVKVISINQKTN